MSEDCLYLNIWTPAQNTTARLPVMVWVHGGGFFLGSGNQFDGEAFARRGIVVVTLNYRLGGLGFLAHPTLSRESRHGVSGNYGLLDQVEALRWVQMNIAHFGGDPHKVTFGGQSAGAMSAALLMISPQANGLFQQAIAESLPEVLGPFLHLRERRYGYTSNEELGEKAVPDVAALRAALSEQVVGQLRTRSFFGTGTYYQPVVDGWVVPRDPSELLGTARQQKTPLLMGVNADEGNFYAPFGAPRTLAEYRAWLEREFPSFVDRILSRYPARSDSEVTQVAVRVLGDFTQEAPAVLTARAASRETTVYMYRFSRVSPLNQKRWHGAAHTAEIPYVFGQILVKPGEWDEQDETLSKTMPGAWIQFVKTGNPNGDGLPAWPVYRTPRYEQIDFGDAIAVNAHVTDAQVSFWSQIFDEMRVADRGSTR
jgi:para-nitrobenzyl esterase